MRKRSGAVSEGPDDLRPEYRFDYSNPRPNPYAARLQGKGVAVILDAEVAAAFPTSQSVNTALRAKDPAPLEEQAVNKVFGGRRSPLGRR